MNSSELPHDNTPKKNKKKTRYPTVVLTIIIINVLVIAAVLVWLYITLSNYESQTPNNALNTYFTQLSEDSHDTIMAQADFEPNEMNSWDDYFAVLDEMYGDTDVQALTFRQTMSADLQQGEMLYSVYSGEDMLGTVLLAEDESSPTSWAVRTQIPMLPSYTITAPEFATVFVNGVEILASEGTGDMPVTINYIRDGAPMSVEIFSSLNDISIAPTVVQYQTPPMLAEPEVTATLPDGSSCDVLLSAEEATALITAPVPSAQAQTLAQRMELVAKTYSDFITEDGSLAALRPMVYSDTSIYQEFAEYQTGWYLDHESREFSDIEVGNLVMHSDDAFTGHIDFTATIVRNGEPNIFNASYDMAFIQQDEEWLLVGLHARTGITQPVDT